MRVNTNIYNYLSTNLVSRKTYQTHKSSQLKEVVNKMAKYNSKSPLFILSLSDSKQEQVINIKDSAMAIRDITYSLSEPSSPVYQNKALYSEDPDVVTGTIKRLPSDASTDSLTLSISSLAKKQVNTGNFLNKDQRSFTPDTYAFSIDTINERSHFAVSITREDTNLDIMNTLSTYINNRSLGISANVLHDGSRAAIELTSTDTGIPSTEDGLHFSFVANEASDQFINTLGLSSVTTMPANSEFSINGESHTAASNHISINQSIELDFHNTSSSPATISFIPDKDTIMSQLNTFVSSYNSLVALSNSSATSGVGVRKLSEDISGLFGSHQNELPNIGLNIDENRYLQIDESKLIASIESGEFSDFFSHASSFKEDVDSITNRLLINPMAYVDKVMVTYPNTNNKLGFSYTRSLYSGLIYNNYV